MRRVALSSLAFAALLVSFALIYLVPTAPGAAERTDCLVEPRSPSELLALVGAPAEVLIVPAASPRLHPYPDDDMGTTDSGTISAQWRVVSQAVKCARASDAPRLYALYSDDFLRRSLGAAAAPVNVAGLPAVPVWRGSWQLGDGRVGTVFSEPQPSTGPGRAKPIYFVFVKVGDRWLIDDAVPFAQEESAESTP